MSLVPLPHIPASYCSVRNLSTVRLLESHASDSNDVSFFALARCPLGAWFFISDLSGSSVSSFPSRLVLGWSVVAASGYSSVAVNSPTKCWLLLPCQLEHHRLTLSVPELLYFLLPLPDTPTRFGPSSTKWLRVHINSSLNPRTFRENCQKVGFT